VEDYPHLTGVSLARHTPKNFVPLNGSQEKRKSRNKAKRDVAHCRVATSMRRKKPRDRIKPAKATVVALS
jgi:hypothetical protein